MIYGYPFQWWIQDFPLGGVLSHWGGTDLRHGCFLAKTYAKMKELDPVGGHVLAAPPPGSANAFSVLQNSVLIFVNVMIFFQVYYVFCEKSMTYLKFLVILQ